MALIVLITGALDFAAAQACKGRCDFVFAREHRKDYRQKHPVFHHTLAPNVSVMARWGRDFYPLATNSLGFKDLAPREVPLEGERFRLLLIGDSFTEGVGVVYADTFAGRLATALDGEAEVLNAGVAATSPAIHYAKIRHLIETVGLRVDHVAVFVDVSDIYDEAKVYSLDADGVARSSGEGDEHMAIPAFGRTLIDGLKDNSIIATFVYRLRDWLVYELRRLKMHISDPDRPERLADLDLWREKLAQSGEFGWWFDDKAFAEWGQRGLERAQGNMDRLRTLLARHGIGLTVAVYPWPNHLLRGDFPSRHAEVWREWAAARGIPLIDLFPPFFAGDDAGRTVVDHYLPFDIHWNAEGHRRVAEELLPYFRDLARGAR